MRKTVTVFYTRANDRDLYPNNRLLFVSTDEYDVYIAVHKDICPEDVALLKCVEIIESTGGRHIYHYEYTPDLSGDTKSLLETYYVPMNYVASV
jgi:hypothetical protein